ncbi:MAG: Ig-like domain-containing protein, partial [Planctomycetota bacterium]
MDVSITPTSATVPYTAGFEEGSLALLGSEWSISTTGSGTVAIVNTDSPHGGSYQLKFDQTATGASTQNAILQLDMSGVAGATDLSLDFWIKQPSGLSLTNSLSIYVSGNGTNWITYIHGINTDTVFTYYHVGFDLDAALSGAGIALDSDVYFKFTHQGTVASHETVIDDLRISQTDVLGPRVASITPTGMTGGPVTGLTVIFENPIDPSTFTSSDITVTGATQTSVSLAGNPIDSGDHRTFTVNFSAAQVVNGTYAVKVGPAINDPAGNAMNMDGDLFLGRGASDAFDGSFTIGPAVAQSLTVAEGFEGTDLTSLVGWSFSSGGAGNISLTSANNPIQGSKHLKFDQTLSAATGTEDAILMLDLSDHVGSTSMTVDFWVQQLNVSISINKLSLAVSGDGMSWTDIASSITPDSVNSYTHFVYDLDLALAAAGIAMDQDVFLRFRHSGTDSSHDMTLDDVRVRDGVVGGPRIIAQNPTGTFSGSFTSISVTFANAIDPATFTADDFLVFGPGNTPFAVSGNPVDSGDHRTFTINFLTAQYLGGTYQLGIRPYISDPLGNLMDQDNDGLNGETTDSYLSSVVFDSLSPLTVPYTQNFDLADIGLLAHWKAETTGSGTVSLTAVGSPHGGSRHVIFSQNASGVSTESASFLLDLSSQVGASDLMLDFWLKSASTSSSNGFAVMASGDGINWSSIAALIQPHDSTTYGHVVIDLDAALAAAGILFDADVYLKLVHSGTSTSHVMYLDDVRVSRGDLFGAKILSSQLMGPVQGPYTGIQVTFNKDINGSSFTTADVTVTGPNGVSVSLAGNPIDSGDHRTFVINFASPQTIHGTYTWRVGSAVLDLAGNPMNQDDDFLVGEPTDFYASTFITPAPAPTAFPVNEGFEAGSIDALSSWVFSTTGTATVTSTNANGPHDGSYHLRFGQTSSTSSTAAATLVVDMSGAVGRTDLTLDFWVKQLGSTSGNSLQLAVSGDGTTWTTVAASVNPGALNLYTTYAWDLDVLLANAGIALDGDVYFRFSRSATSSTSSLFIDDIRISAADPFGPSIVASAIVTPLEQLSVTFSEEINVPTFTASDVVILNPMGMAIPLVAAPVDSGDHRTFYLNIAPFSPLGGHYRISIGPDVKDVAGNLMDQNGDNQAGTTADVYSFGFDIDSSPTAQASPYAEGFESGDPLALAGWSFATTGAGTIELTTANSPPSGSYQLQFGQFANTSSSPYSTQSATLLLDLADQAGNSDLTLDFLIRKRSSSGTQNSITFSISGDGNTWHALETFSSSSSYLHCHNDLDQTLANLGISLDGDVYVRFFHTGSTTDAEIYIDDIRIGNHDVEGPRVVSISPSGQTSSPLSSVSVTFSKEIDVASFTSGDIQILDPVNDTVPLLGDPVDTGDHRTFVIPFASPRAAGGTYTVKISKDITDPSGIPMNQDGDNVDGETADKFSSTFVVVPAPQAVPVTEDFEGGALSSLGSWSFLTEDEGNIAVVSNGDAHAGTSQLHFSQGYLPGFPLGPPYYGTATATLVIDLSAHVGATDLTLDFWAKQLGTTIVSSLDTNVTRLYVSGDGTTFHQVALSINGNEPYLHFAYDLDQILLAKGIALDGDVYLTFVRLSSNM